MTDSLHAIARRLASPPGFDATASRIYRRHLVFAVGDAVAGGILANAPVVAIKELGARDWQLPLPLLVSSFGMLAAPALTERMAGRRAATFAAVPAAAYGGCALLLAVADAPVFFLLLVGLCNLFEVLSRPAVGAVIRVGYPVGGRGAAAGEVRRWCAGVFLAVNLLSASALDRTTDRGLVIVALAATAAAACLVGAVAFAGVRTPTDRPGPARPPATPWTAVAVVRADARFRRYLVGCFLFGFFGLLYVSFVPAFLTRSMGYGYVEVAVLVHVIPSVATVAATGALGRWFDRSNPLVGWQAVRLGWGLDPLVLILAPAAAAVWGPAGFAVCVLARTCRGLVMGGSWVLWWQIGVNYFAPPGPATGRYLAVLTGLSGVMRLAATVIGMALLGGLSPAAVMALGGVGVLASGLHARAQAAADRRLTAYRTYADLEPGPAGE